MSPSLTIVKTNWTQSCFFVLFFGIGAYIRTRREILYLPYAVFFFLFSSSSSKKMPNFCCCYKIQHYIWNWKSKYGIQLKCFHGSSDSRGGALGLANVQKNRRRNILCLLYDYSPRPNFFLLVTPSEATIFQSCKTYDFQKYWNKN